MSLHPGRVELCRVARVAEQLTVQISHDGRNQSFVTYVSHDGRFLTCVTRNDFLGLTEV